VPNQRNHAVVIGVSISGLLAARALETVYRRVTVVEKDEVLAAAVSRKSVPQGNHAHGLLSRGRDVIESLFPGVSRELVALGAIEVDYLNDMIWVSDGHAICPGPSSISGLLVSRPVLESHLRARLLQSANVDLLSGVCVTRLMTDASHDRVLGVVCGPEDEQKIMADLVIDASGRGSSTPKWLRAMNYTPPREEKIEVGITYTTCTFRRNPEDLGGKVGAVVAASGPGWRCAALLAQEGNRWIASIGGYFGDQAPADRDGFLAFAKTLPIPEIHEVLAQAEQLTPFVRYSFPASLRRHYEGLRRFPEGYLVVGDALCSFNPIYGQGMTLAALEAEALRECLTKQRHRLAPAFFPAASALIDVPWDIVVGNDLRNPRVEARRDLRHRLVNWYFDRVKRRLPLDLVVSTAFLSVSNMKAHPSTLLSPHILRRVFVVD
jgi:2-polyprenyl-6-methoxyphenol hydroxylase-like FAD-dependent oxidoreductase